MVQEINITGKIKAKLTPLQKNISAEIVLPETVREREFDGPYEVIPNFSDQTLATKNHHMTNDVTIDAIPVNMTTNESGGYTVLIGGV